MKGPRENGRNKKNEKKKKKKNPPPAVFEPLYVSV